MSDTPLRLRLSEAIVKRHGVLAMWMRSTPVKVTAKENGPWQGDVETFELLKHPTAKYCYAWVQQEKAGAKLIMALAVPPVNSPQTAVREFLQQNRDEK